MPVFHLLAERYLDEAYSPDRVADETGIPAATIRRLAAELATVAFEQEVVIDQPWTDAFGRRHEKMIGRPVGIHAMRGISAHANGFHTCRALHLLQTASRQHRLSRRLPLQGALPQTDPACTQTCRQGEPYDAGETDGRPSPWLSKRSRRPSYR